MRSRQRHAAAEPEVLRAALPRPLTAREAAVCSCDLAATLLFLRAQLPALFSEMRERAAEAECASAAPSGAAPPAHPLRRKRVSAADRRARKTVLAVEAMAALLTPAVFEDAALESVMLVLGASASRPREAYELRLAIARDGVGGAEQRTVGRDAGADAARRATRVLVGALADAPEAHSGLKLFVLLRTRADAAVPPGFLPKRNLRPALHRAKVVRTVLVGPQDELADAPPAQPPAEPPAAAVAGEVWLQCKVVVRGLPRARGSPQDG